MVSPGALTVQEMPGQDGSRCPWPERGWLEQLCGSVRCRGFGVFVLNGG